MIVSLDLATRLTGWTAGRGDTTPDCGVWEFPQCGDDLGRMLCVLDDFLTITVDRFKPTVMVYEAPILRRIDDLLKVRKLYSLGSHVEFVCRRRGIECHEVSIAAIKKEVTGNAFAEKDDMVAVARTVGLTLPKGPGAKDAADSFGGWLLALRHYEPEFSAAWDKRIWSGRSALL